LVVVLAAVISAACADGGDQGNESNDAERPKVDAQTADNAIGPEGDGGARPILDLVQDSRSSGDGGTGAAGAPDASEVVGTKDAGGDEGEEADGGPIPDAGANTRDVAAEERILRLWTFNILNPSNPLASGADVHKRTRIVIDAIKAEKPDIIALQEVVQSGDVPNRARFIAEETGYRWEWHQTYSIVLYDEGIAVLSRHPILSTRTHKLPHKDLILFNRYVLGARVETAAGEVDFYCTHMTAGGSDSESADQAVEAWSFMSAESAGVPAFLAGDLNAEPDTPAMRFLRGEAPRGGKTGDLSDLWLVTRPEDPGYTISPDNPHDRIDYIYASPRAMEVFEPVDCRLIFAHRVDASFASDHIGVACDLRW
jgi:endonuclease/exonuclease/phosphatase family metal-dependent hydrolase